MEYGTAEFGDKTQRKTRVATPSTETAISKIVKNPELNTHGQLNSERNNKQDTGVSLAHTVGSLLERSIPEQSSITQKLESSQTTPNRRLNTIEQPLRNLIVKSVIEVPNDDASHQSSAKNTTRINNKKIPPIDASELQPIKHSSAKLRQHPRQVRPKIPMNKETVRQIEHSTTNELLQVAHNIKIGGISVRELYETNKIDYKGLTTIIKEAVSGGNVEEILNKVQLGAEAQQGRKIEMRHDNPIFTTNTIQPESTEKAKERISSLAKQIEQVNSASTIPETTIASEVSVAEQSYQQMQQTFRKKRIATITIFTVITLLALCLIIWLVLL